MLKNYFIIGYIFLISYNLYSQNPVNQIVPKEILLKKTMQDNFAISPNGKYFVEVIRSSLANDIAIIDIDAHKLFKRIPIGKRFIEKLYWVTSRRLLFESQGVIFAIDIDGSNLAIIVDRLAEKITHNWNYLYKNFIYNKIIDILPHNKNEVLVETYDYKGFATVSRVNIYTAQKHEILNGSKYKINKWIADRAGNIKLGLKINRSEIDYMEFDPEKAKWKTFNVFINNIKYPLKVTGNSYFNQKISFEGFGYEPNIIYLSTNINSDLRKLLKYDIKRKEIVETLVESINCDVSDPMGEKIKLIFNNKVKKLIGVRYQGIVPTYSWFSKDFANYHQFLNKKYFNFINDIIDVDEVNERFLVYQWSDINAGNIGVFKSKDSTYSVLLNLNQELNDYKLSKTENIIVKTRDNYKLSGYLNLPINYSKDSLVPLVIIPHGGPWSRDYWELNKFSQYFATRGYATLRINYRGSTGFGKSHLMAGVKSINSTMIDDIKDGTKHVIDNYSIDRSKVFIFGHSYGGYATYMSLLKYHDIYSSGIAISAPTDIKLWLKEQKKQKNYFAYEFWNIALGSKDSDYLSEISPINHAEDFSRPILIFHGKNDKTIDVYQAEKMAKKLKDNNKNVKLEVLQNEGHTIFDSNSLGYILDAANEFFMGTDKK